MYTDEIIESYCAIVLPFAWIFVISQMLAFNSGNFAPNPVDGHLIKMETKVLKNQIFFVMW